MVIPYSLAVFVVVQVFNLYDDENLTTTSERCGFTTQV